MDGICFVHIQVIIWIKCKKVVKRGILAIIYLMSETPGANSESEEPYVPPGGEPPESLIPQNLAYIGHVVGNPLAVTKQK